jgi:hypothetical protein
MYARSTHVRVAEHAYIACMFSLLMYTHEVIKHLSPGKMPPRATTHVDRHAHLGVDSSDVYLPLNLMPRRCPPCPPPPHRSLPHRTRAQLRDAPRFWKQRPDLREHIDNANVPWSGSTRAAKYTLGMISSTRAEETCSSGTARRGVVRQHVSWWAAEMVKPWGPGRAEGDSLRWRRL